MEGDPLNVFVQNHARCDDALGEDQVVDTVVPEAGEVDSSVF